MKINKGPQKNQHKIDKNIDFKINKGNIENINTKINIQYQQKNGWLYWLGSISDGQGIATYIILEYRRKN